MNMFFLQISNSLFCFSVSRDIHSHFQTIHRNFINCAYQRKNHSFHQLISMTPVIFLDNYEVDK